MNFVRADNLCRGILAITRKKVSKSEIYHFTSSEWITNFDILNLYCKKFKIKKTFIKKIFY